MVNVSGIVNICKSGVKLASKKANGIDVYREVLKNGNVVTASFKEGKPLKTIIQSKVIENKTNTFLGVEQKNVNVHAKVYNHVNNESFYISRITNFRNNNKWMRFTPEKIHVIETDKNNTILLKSIEKKFKDGSSLLVDKRI